jgi:hypothetical protein
MGFPARCPDALRAPMTRARTAIGLLCLFIVSCAPNFHRAELYRYNHVQTTAVEAVAEGRCLSAVGPGSVPARTFVTDACTLWPDASFTGTGWQQCCVEHDIAYWCGGTRVQRRTADRELLQCVSAEYGAWMGAIMWTGTRVGGHPLFPAYWRWGYGHDYPLGF